MNKTELICRVAAQSGLGQKDAARAVKATLDVIAATLKTGSEVTLPGFGSFRIRERKARQGFNPATKAKISIPARRVVSFKPSLTLQPPQPSAPKRGKRVSRTSQSGLF